MSTARYHVWFMHCNKWSGLHADRAQESDSV
jgi:hypothetical protein